MGVGRGSFRLVKLRGCRARICVVRVRTKSALIWRVRPLRRDGNRADFGDHFFSPRHSRTSSDFGPSCVGIGFAKIAEMARSDSLVEGGGT